MLSEIKSASVFTERVLRWDLGKLQRNKIAVPPCSSHMQIQNFQILISEARY